MVDKLDCCLELGTPYTKIASEIRDEVRRSRESAIPFAKDRDYQAVVNLNDLMDVDAKLYIHSRYGRHNDKLELLHTGEKSWSGMLGEIEKVCSGDPFNLSTRRVDLACDMPDVSVPRFVRTVKADYKRNERQYGKIEALDGDGKTVDFMHIARISVETLQLGSRPNLFRVYDKTRETFVRYTQAKNAHYREASNLVGTQVMKIGQVPTTDKQLNRGFAKRLRNAAEHMYPFPSFYDWCGLWEWTVLTRIERQIGDNVPVTISTLGGLHANATTFNPFERLRFAADSNGPEVDRGNFTAMEYAAGSWWALQLSSGEMSFQQLCKELQIGRRGKRSGNLKRTLEKFEPFFRQGSVGEDGLISISSSELYERYRESVTRQLAA
jgi:hypothetical protein